MNVSKVKYKTKHRDELIRFFKSVPGEHITVSDICGYFRDQGATIGTATVYRQLERLVDEGILKKYVIDANSPACFEYAPEPVGSVLVPCFHCKCELCGKLIHLHCEELAEIQNHLEEEHHFLVNAMRTVFYGLCEDCAKKVENEEI